MSYDITIGDADFNYTYNVSKMFYDHIPELDDRPGGLRALDGMTGKEACAILADAFERIHNNISDNWNNNEVGEPKFCAIYDAPNGWGSAVGALVLLSRILSACALNPRKKVRVM